MYYTNIDYFIARIWTRLKVEKLCDGQWPLRLRQVVTKNHH